MKKRRLSDSEFKHLVDGLIQGNKHSQEFLYKLMQPMVRKIIAALEIKNWHDAEELVQSTFAKAYTRVELYDASRGAFTTWLAAIAKYEASNFLKKNKKKCPISVTNHWLDNTFEALSIGPKTEEEMEKYCVDITDGAFSRLDGQERLAILLRAEGYQFKEIGELFDLSTSRAGQILENAQRALIKAKEKATKRELKKLSC